MKNKPMIITLCKRCRSDFERAGKVLIRDHRYPGEDDCCFCNVRRGYTFKVVKKGEGGR